MKISFWSMLGTIGELSSQLTEAYQDDNKIDAVEMLKVGNAVAQKLNLEVDPKTQKVITAVIEVTDEVLKAAEDDVITAVELTQIITKVCDSLGIDISGGIQV